MPLAIRAEHQRPPVRRPDGFPIHRRVEREARAKVTNQVVDPDVGVVSLGHGYRRAVLVRRKLHSPQVGWISYGDQALAVPIHPRELLASRSSAGLVRQQPRRGGGKET